MSTFHKAQPFRAFQFNSSLSSEYVSIENETAAQKAKLIEALGRVESFNVELIEGNGEIETTLSVTQLKWVNGKAISDRTFIMDDGDWLVEDGLVIKYYNLMTDDEFRNTAITGFRKLSESEDSSSADVLHSFQFTEELDKSREVDIDSLNVAFRLALPNFDLLGMNFHWIKSGDNGEPERVLHILSGLDESGDYPKPAHKWTLCYGDHLIAHPFAPGGYMMVDDAEFQDLLAKKELSGLTFYKFFELLEKTDQI